jgi:outer membrane protein OmpA-like peptidoglycan-associated protein
MTPGPERQAAWPHSGIGCVLEVEPAWRKHGESSSALAARAGGGAGAAVSRLGRGQRHSEEESRVRQELAAGHARLPGVKFAAGADAIDPSSEPSLQSLALVMTDSPGVFLVQGRADPGASPEAAAQLASARAAAIKGWLVGGMAQRLPRRHW